MMRPALIAIASVCVLAGAACDRDTVGNGPATRPNAEDRATQLPSSQQGVTAQTSFDIVDQNSDGIVSREEASTVDGLDFAAADADESSSLNRQEYALAMEKARPRG